MDGEVEALVQAGSVTTRYLRAGHGPPVLLLLAQWPRTAWGMALFRELAASFRVVAPIRGAEAWGSSTPDDTSAWIRGLLDGLGLLEVRVVVDETLAPALVPVLEPDGDRIRTIRVVAPGNAPGGEEVPGGLWRRQPRPPPGG
ncbi:MAG TPA: hypothetical protein VLA43_12390 [Longimicrobiales bacterium]|nr:hypothetical protein [Longimicrobiales bacterium]